MLLPYEKPNTKTRIVIIATLIVLGLALGYQTVTGLDKNVTPSPVHGSLLDGCTHTATGLHCDLTDEATKQKAKGVTWYEKVTVIASVTMYSRQSSCHNKRGAVCLTAIGRDTVEGRTIACPYFLHLGIHVVHNNHVYTCEDRTARWVQKKHGPTFDIFIEDNTKALRWGRRDEEVTYYRKI